MVDYLITGCSGYIGSRIIDYLKLNHIAYLGIDKLCDESKNIVEFNLTDKDKTFKVLEDSRPKTIIHCGTFSAIPYRDDFLFSFKEDAVSLSNILEYLKYNSQVRLIFFSSSYVYSGISKDSKCEENLTLNPTHNFGISKLFFEKLIMRCHENSIIFRLSSVFGSGNQLQPNAIKNMIKQAIQDKVVDVWGNGLRKMQYIYIDDVVQSIIDSNSFKPGVYNLGGTDYLSVSETASIIAEKTLSKLNFLKDKKEGHTLPFMIVDKLRDENSGSLPKGVRSSLCEYINEFIV